MSASPPAGKGFVDRMTRVPERAVQMALAGHGRQVSSLLTPVAWMFVIAALLIALDSAAGVGVLVLLQRGIDSGVAAGDMSTIGICALLALCLVAIGWCCYALQTIFAAPRGRVGTAYGTLTQLQPPATPESSLAREAHRLASYSHDRRR
ncbi:ATP-binding protein [Salmonella enterica]|nr:ATP-binding protein [Salmonella enterica]